MSLRLKLLIAVIVLVFAGLVVSDVVTYTSLRSFLIKRVDQQLGSGWPVVLRALNDENDQQGRGGPFGETPALPPGTYGVVMDSGGNALVGPVWLYGVTGAPKPS